MLGPLVLWPAAQLLATMENDGFKYPANLNLLLGNKAGLF
jgi:hypothetical protein